jgi:dihydroflavonol-4-reductase
MILVTGGTGLVGAHLLVALMQKNELVRATHRASSDLEAVRRTFAFYGENTERSYERIEWVEANITEIPSLTKAFKDVTRVFHCAAYISFNPKNFRALKKTNIEGTANVVNLCLSENIEKLCYVSSIATLAASTSEKPIDEESYWNPEEDNNVYSLTKHGAEMEVWRGIQEGLNAVIVNPGVILGSGFWRSGSGIIIRNASKGSKYYTDGSSGFVDILDVVEVMIRLMDKDISNERFVLVSENLSYKELLTALAINFGNPPPGKAFNRSVFIWLCRLDAFTSWLLGRKRRILKSMIDSLFSKSVYSSDKIKYELNFEFRPIRQTIERVVKNYSSSS